MKAYTDLPQSQKLAEILPLESADMHYLGTENDGYIPGIGHSDVMQDGYEKYYSYIPCWSLSALMDILDRGATFKTPQGWTCQAYIENKAITSSYYSNPVDACYEMIIRLNELNLL